MASTIENKSKEEKRIIFQTALDNLISGTCFEKPLSPFEIFKRDCPIDVNETATEFGQYLTNDRIKKFVKALKLVGISDENRINELVNANEVVEKAKSLFDNAIWFNDAKETMDKLFEQYNTVKYNYYALLAAITNANI